MDCVQVPELQGPKPWYHIPPSGGKLVVKAAAVGTIDKLVTRTTAARILRRILLLRTPSSAFSSVGETSIALNGRVHRTSGFDKSVLESALSDVP